MRLDGTTLSAIGQTIEFLGLLWIGTEAAISVQAAKSTLDKALKIEATAMDRIKQGQNQDEVKTWQDDQYREHGIKLGTWLEIKLFRQVVRASAADTLRWKGGAFTVLIGFLITVIGGWVQAFGG